MTADTTAPSTPTGLGRAGRPAAPSTSAGPAATDNVAVSRYNLHRGTQRRLHPRAGNRIAQPTGTSYADSGLATGSYFYKVTAEDAAGNISAASNEASATVADATPPSAPSTLAATAAGSTINLSWGAATDNVGVSRYNLHRGTTQRLHPHTANRIAQPTGLSYTDTSLAPGSYFYKLTAEDAAGNISAALQHRHRHRRRHHPAQHPHRLNATGGAGQANLTWTAATDNVAVSRYNLHRSTSSGFTPTTANRIAQPTATSYTDTGLAAGTYYYKLTAEDAAGNISPASNQATATVTAPPVTGLVAAYGFDERHRHHHHRPIRQRQQRHAHQRHLGRPTAGKYGNALTFNGTNAIVTVPDANSLDLTTGMTLEAWVRPTAARQHLPHGRDEGAARAAWPTACMPTAPATTGCRSARCTSAATETRSAPRSCR